MDQAIVTDAQNCGNILAGVGPFAIERGLLTPADNKTDVTIFMENTGQTAIATVDTPKGVVTYEGNASIDGVPRSAAPVPLAFKDTQGASCGALLPTGSAVDEINGVEVTMIDNGMPVVLIAAENLGVTGYEDREELNANEGLKAKLEAIRLLAGPLMNLGDVAEKSVPKMTLVAPPKKGGAITTRTFIPHRCHASIGVLGAVSVATACALENGPASRLAELPEGSSKELVIEHPIGATTAVLDFAPDGSIIRSAMLRTARKLFDGNVFA